MLASCNAVHLQTLHQRSAERLLRAEHDQLAAVWGPRRAVPRGLRPGRAEQGETLLRRPRALQSPWVSPVDQLPADLEAMLDEASTHIHTQRLLLVSSMALFWQRKGIVEHRLQVWQQCASVRGILARRMLIIAPDLAPGNQNTIVLMSSQNYLLKLVKCSSDKQQFHRVVIFSFRPKCQNVC